MEIKEYDLVKYQNGIYRVMSIVSPTTMKIATYGPVHINSLELSERASIPSLSVGDYVIVKAIPGSEKHYYTTGWRDEMTKMVEVVKCTELAIPIGVITPSKLVDFGLHLIILKRLKITI